MRVLLEVMAALSLAGCNPSPKTCRIFTLHVDPSTAHVDSVTVIEGPCQVPEVSPVPSTERQA